MFPTLRRLAPAHSLLSRHAASFRASLLLLALTPGLALAQEGRREIVEIVVTPNRTPEPAERVGSAVTTVRAETIVRANPSSLADVLRAVPGLDVTENGGPGSTTAIRLRGANAGQTLVLIDGVRVNDASVGSGEFDFSNLLPPTSIARIEVLRGPQSALYGSDAIGGVINIITKDGRGPTRVTAQVEAGSYSTVSGGATVAGARDQWRFAVSGFGARSNGFSRYGYRVAAVEAVFPRLESDGFSRLAGLMRLGFDTDFGLTLDASFSASTLTSQYDSGFGAFPDTPSRARSTLLNGWARAAYETADRTFRHSLTIYGNETERRYLDFFFAGPPSIASNVFRTDSSFIGRRFGAEYQGSARLGQFGTLTFGARSENERIATTSQDVTPFPAPLTRGIPAGQTTHSVFGLWSAPIGERFSVSLGGRYDHIESGPNFATWRATAAYRHIETGTTLRASAGTGGKAPTLFQRLDPLYGNAALRPETSFGWDVGLDQALPGGRGRLSITYFENRLRNLIDFDFNVPPAGAFINVARARTQGVEVGGEIALVPDMLTLNGAYTYLEARDEATGLPLARRPKHAGRVSLAWRPIEQLTIEPILLFASDRFSSANGFNRLPAYTRFDMKVDYRLNPNLTLYARGENLSNVRYQEVFRFGTTGRAIYAGLRGTW